MWRFLKGEVFKNEILRENFSQPCGFSLLFNKQNLLLAITSPQPPFCLLYIIYARVLLINLRTFVNPTAAKYFWHKCQ